MSGFDDALNAFNMALNDYVNGDPRPVLAVFSREDDVTLCNPIGPPCRGRANVEWAAAEPSSHFTDGKVSGFEEVSSFVAADLGYVVRIERGQMHIDGSPEPVPYSLRVTLIFRREDEAWKIVHRHADPITTRRPLASAMEQPT
ncbi:MAG: nuclear transport factor 2 family protein [Actinomycetota bacterium]|nr:nuclear transport factor 2 family protein [Actinomycetota bacterium]